MPIVFVTPQSGRQPASSIAWPGPAVISPVLSRFEPAMGGKWLESLSEVAPNVKRVAALYNPNTHTGHIGRRSKLQLARCH